MDIKFDVTTYKDQRQKRGKTKLAPIASRSHLRRRYLMDFQTFNFIPNGSKK